MIMMVSAIKKNGEEVDGIFNTYTDSGVRFGGFITYLKDEGYSDIRVFPVKGSIPYGDYTKYEDFQEQFAAALRSVKYYPSDPYNDALRRNYARMSNHNQKFSVPKEPERGLY